MKAWRLVPRCLELGELKDYYSSVFSAFPSKRCCYWSGRDSVTADQRSGSSFAKAPSESHCSQASWVLRLSFQATDDKRRLV